MDNVEKQTLQIGGFALFLACMLLIGRQLNWPLPILSYALAVLMFLIITDYQILSPFFLFPAAYLVYLGIGSINFAPVTVRGFRGYIPSTQFYYYSLGLLCYFVGLFLSKYWDGSKSNSQLDEFGIDIDTKRLRNYSILWWIAGIVPAILIIRNNGIVLTRPDIRLSISPLLAQLLHSNIVVGILLSVVYHRNLPRLMIGLCIAMLPMLLAWPYRSPVFLMVLVIVTILLLKRTWSGGQLVQWQSFSRSTWYLIGLGVLIFAGAAFSVYRLTYKAGIRILVSHIDPTGLRVPQNPGFIQLTLMSLWSLFFREGPSVFSSLVRYMGRRFDYGHGRVWLSSFITFLPGKQSSAREIISTIANGGFYTSTLTPTILGTFYVDFGVYGLAGFMLAVGFLLGLTYRRYTQSSAHCVIYGYFMSSFLLAIHSGWFDPVYIVFLPLGLWFTLRRASYSQQPADISAKGSSRESPAY